MTRKGGLGRGLGALIPGATAIGEYLSDSPLRELAVEAIAVNPKQPRANFDESAQQALTESVRDLGVLQPIVVRETDGGYELVAGERRLRAARAAGLTTIPAVVRETADDELLRTALVENIQREALNPLEEAGAYRQLLDDLGLTHDDLATRVGRSRTHVSNTVRLLNLPASVQRRVAAGVLSAGHARALLGLTDPDAQERLANRAVAEGMSVRAVEEAVATGDAGRRPVTRARSEQAPGLAEVADRLGELLETRVRVEMGRRKGRIVVEFASPEDLDRIVSQLALSLEVAGFSDSDAAH